MTTKCSILTLAISLAIAGCASDNTSWREPGSSGAQMNNNGTSLPDNPQVPAVNDKNRAMSHLTEADMAFVRDAQAGGMYEVTSSQKAVFKTTDSQVKTLAQHMVDDHTKANMQLNNLASRKGLPDTAMLTASQIDMLSQLDKLSGTDFDREYLNQQQAAHQGTIAKFESAAANANDKDIRDWATATLPTLRDHLTMVKSQINGTPSNLGNNTGSTTGGMGN
jgi:putative membrane protein